MKRGHIILIIIAAILILIGLPVAMITFSWFSAQKNVEEHQNQLDYYNDCQFVMINVEKVEKLSSGKYELILKRFSGGKDISGIILEFNNQEDKNYSKDIKGNIPPSTNKKIVIDDVSFDPVWVGQTPYFSDKKDKYLCEQTSTGSLLSLLGS